VLAPGEVETLLRDHDLLTDAGDALETEADLVV
jgi:hypothetical protein